MCFVSLVKHVVNQPTFTRQPSQPTCRQPAHSQSTSTQPVIGQTVNQPTRRLKTVSATISELRGETLTPFITRVEFDLELRRQLRTCGNPGVSGHGCGLMQTGKNESARFLQGQMYGLEEERDSMRTTLHEMRDWYSRLYKGKQVDHTRAMHHSLAHLTTSVMTDPHTPKSTASMWSSS